LCYVIHSGIMQVVAYGIVYSQAISSIVHFHAQCLIEIYCHMKMLSLVKFMLRLNGKLRSVEKISLCTVNAMMRNINV